MRRLLVATCEAHFGGAGKIATQVLRALGRRDIDCIFVGLDEPHLYRSVAGPAPQVMVPAPVVATAIPENDLFIPFRLAERIVEIVIARYSPGLRVTLWGTYLLPFGHAALLAAQVLRQRNIPVRLVVSPAGSDVWQIGPQLPNIARYVLSAPEVDVRLTYTAQFAAEIRSQFGMRRTFHLLPPILDTRRFKPPTAAARARARRALGLRTNEFVMCCHCNMRPIKQPEKVVAIARDAAVTMSRPATLLMIGPHSRTRSVPTAQRGALRVIWTGVADRVERYLVAADAALNWSAHDSFNGSLMEAMACGLPVVSTDVVGVRPHITRSRGGRVFAITEAGHAAAFLAFLAADDDQRRAIGRDAARHVREHFGGPKLIARYVRTMFPANDRQD